MKKEVIPVAVVLSGDPLFDIINGFYDEKTRLEVEVQNGEDDLFHQYGYEINDYILIPYPCAFEIFNKSDLIIL